jgi:hypothetical protein
VKMVAKVHFGRNSFFHFCGRKNNSGLHFDKRDEVLELLPALKVLILEDTTGRKHCPQRGNTQVRLSEEEWARRILAKGLQNWFSVLNRLEYGHGYGRNSPEHAGSRNKRSNCCNLQGHDRFDRPMRRR